jgi:hypothetical protein
MALLAALTAGPGWARAGDGPSPPPGPSHPVVAKVVPAFFQWPPGCYGHFNDYSCGSFRSEMTFLFGSCREFFGEACLKGPPVVPGVPRPGRSTIPPYGSPASRQGAGDPTLGQGGGGGCGCR